MSPMRQRLWATAKTALIVLLLCSAVLTALSLIEALMGGQGLTRRLGQALGWIPAEPAYAASSQDYPAAALPLTVSMTGENGRGSTQGDPERTAALYELLSRQLGEALANAAEPTVISRHQWQTLLSGQSASLLYAGQIPLESLAHWLGAEPSAALTGLSASHLSLCVDGQQVSLLLRGEDQWLCLTTGVEPSGLRTALASCRPDGSVFALESEAYDRVDPLSLITVSTVAPRAESSNPLADGDRIDAAATLLGLNPYRDTAYTSAGGTVTITGATGRLQVTTAGVLSYTASAEQTRQSTGDTALIETARQLLAQLTDGLTGEATLQLSGLAREGTTVRVQFDYVLAGYAVQQSQGAAAEVVFADGCLQQLTWQARCYQCTDQTQTLLPARQAAAIVGEGALLEPVYVDAHGSLSCGWRK